MERRRWLVIGVVVLTAVVLLGGSALIVWVFFGSGAETVAGRDLNLFDTDFVSNGERIYFTGTSETGPPITAAMPGMRQMGRGMMTCASCHGPDGRGGSGRMMMTTFTAPDIRYDNLTASEHGQDGDEHDDGEAEHAEHPPYTGETIKRAITEGMNPAGESLNWVMPRWDMTDAQLNDLITYLKTLR